MLWDQQQTLKPQTRLRGRINSVQKLCEHADNFNRPQAKERGWEVILMQGENGGKLCMPKATDKAKNLRWPALHDIEILEMPWDQQQTLKPQRRVRGRIQTVHLTCRYLFMWCYAAFQRQSPSSAWNNTTQLFVDPKHIRNDYHLHLLLPAVAVNPSPSLAPEPSLWPTEKLLLPEGAEGMSLWLSQVLLHHTLSEHVPQQLQLVLSSTWACSVHQTSTPIVGSSLTSCFDINQFTFYVFGTHQGSQQTITGKTVYTKH